MANSDFIEILSPTALADLKLANAEIATMVKNVNVINKNLVGLKTPGGSSAAITKMNNELAKQQILLDRQAISLERVKQAEIRTSIASNQLSASQSRLAITNNRLEQSII